MSRRKVYIVRSGSLHPTTKEFWLSNYYYSNKKAALRSRDEILEINRAKNIDVTAGVSCDKTISIYDYIGEEGKYKARVIVEWDYLGN